jgi:protein O-mannosyl-transferase
MKFSFNLSSRLFLIVALLVLTSANWLVYYPILSHEFVRWDDQAFLLNNPHITALTFENLAWMWREIHLDHWHPLTWLSFAVTYAGAGLDSAAFHRVNLLLHSANTVWFFWLSALIYTLARQHNKTFLHQASAWIVGFIAALLFALHPQRVEIVAWASARKDLLCIFFLLPAFIAYLYYVQSQRIYWYILSLVCFTLALMSKTFAVTFPALLFILDFYPLRRRFSWQLLYEKLPFFGLIIIPLSVTLLGQQQAAIMVDLTVLGLDARILNAAHSVFFYVSQWIAPIYLSPFYPFEAKPLLNALVPLMAVVATTVLVVLLWWLKNQRVWFAAWFFYGISLSPVIGIIQVGSQAAADRYTYFTMLPFYLLAAAAIVALYKRGRSWHPLVLAVGLLWVVGLGYLTREQTALWRDSLSLWQYAVIYAPDSNVTHRNLATEYLFRGDYEKAITHYYFAMNLGAAMIDYSNSAIAYIYTAQLDKALALYHHLLNHYVVNDSAQLAQIYASMGWIYLRQNQPENARSAVQQALNLIPAHPFALNLWHTLEQNALPSAHP